MNGTKLLFLVIMQLVILFYSSFGSRSISRRNYLCREKIKGMHVETIDYGNIQGCTYCHPEIASVGLTEKQAKEKDTKLKLVNSQFQHLEKLPQMVIQMVYQNNFDAKYGEWLGCHMIGDGVTDMVAEAVVARKLETTGHEIIKSINLHPTVSEAIMEAVAAAYGEVIHIYMLCNKYKKPQFCEDH